MTLTHRIIREGTSRAPIAFYSETRVVGGENVPEHGPCIIAATHHNMMLDPAILSWTMPHKRVLHYWSKASLFKNPIVAKILLEACNIPVDRKSKDRQKLLQGTVDALGKGVPVALFPEGTSYTEPRIMQVKDGAAWAALEYTKQSRETGRGDPATIIPVAIVYTNKSKYRSQVVVEYCKPIPMDAYIEQYVSGGEGAARAAAKRLTARIERELIASTINSPDWETLYAARMARELLWPKERSINLDEFVAISQTLVDLFSTPDLLPKFNSTKRKLLTYYSLLEESHLSNSVLSSLPLPDTLDPKRPIPLPSRIRTLFALIGQTLALLIRLPLFAIPLLIHAPAYYVARLGAKMVEDEEETQAQNKVVFGLFLAVVVYSITGIFVWASLSYTAIGALAGFSVIYTLAWYHNSMIDDTLDHARRLVAAWRVLVGVWAPKHWDLSITSLAQYTIPKVPPENPWVDRNRVRSSSRTPPASPNIVAASGSLSPSNSNARLRKKGQKRPPSRRLVRHVLRARVEAAKALSSLFSQLEGSPKDIKVRASSHLALKYGGVLDAKPSAALLSPTTIVEGEDTGADVEEPAGWRSAREVISFLRKRGAKITTLKDDVSGAWAAALSSDNDVSDSDAVSEDLVWVPSSSSGDLRGRT
ncbi:glycerol-3-phosphate-acyltransferase [Trametopsis cervina]|nr:glycerol-3-phosphate-acyltransferase [Trametopsis cervina]